jgi:hypothetical protein
MKRITKITLVALGVALGVVLLASMVPAFLTASRAGVQAATGHVLKFDVAVDCRTFITGPNRGDVFILNGKLFPAETLPSGTATNDPTEAVDGVSPIGDWINRGQNGVPFPPKIAPAYGSAPAFLATHYYILNDGRALTLEGYASAALVSHLSVTGGIGGFRGAAGDVEGMLLGTNATGCPNFRAIFNLEPGSMHGASNN